MSDPSLSAGPDGVVYLSALEVHSPPHGAEIGTTVVVTRSTDGGLSWGAPATVAPDIGRNADKPTLTADPLRPGVAYLSWTQDVGRGREVVLSRTMDGGVAWTPPRVVAVPPRGQDDFSPAVEVRPDGAVEVVFTAVSGVAYSVSHEVIRSHDGGRTWGRPVRLDRLRSFPVPIAYPPPAFVRANAQVFALAGGLGGAYLVSALIDVGRGGRFSLPNVSEIVVSHETGSGAWGPPMTIARVHGMAFLPTVATAGPGRVAVTWYQMPGLRGALKALSSLSPARSAEATIEAATSSDGGQTWSQQPLGPPFDLANVERDKQIFVGDYQGLTATNNGFEAVDVRTPSRSGLDGSDVFAQSLGR